MKAGQLEDTVLTALGKHYLPPYLERREAAGQQVTGCLLNRCFSVQKRWKEIGTQSPCSRVEGVRYAHGGICTWEPAYSASVLSVPCFTLSHTGDFLFCRLR